MPPDWPPARWAASTRPESTSEFFEGKNLKSFMVVNIGKPVENAWHDRLPRLDHDEVVFTA